MDEKTLYQLIDKLNEGEISGAERKKLMDYYNTRQIFSVWDEKLMGDFNEVGDRLYRKLQMSMAPRKKQMRIGVLYKIAAAVLLVIGISMFTYRYLLINDSENVVVSGKQLKEVFLPDGSKVTMNINSKITYPDTFDADRREVDFEGEGFFEVISDEAHPFIVSTSTVKVKVLGTTFNLKAYEEDSSVETSLIHGKVEILTSNEKQTLSTLEPQQKFSIEKKLLEKLQSPIAKSQIQVKSLDFIDQEGKAPVDVAWKEGKFAFSSATLHDIVNEMQRRYNVKISIENDSIANYRYTAASTEESVAEILKSLRLVKPFFYRKEGDKIVVY